MKKIPINQIFWSLEPKPLPPLRTNAETDVVVIGGGMAGMSAAQSFLKKGCSVILIEKDFCGAGASGKSSGFITPDSEYSLSSFVKNFGSIEGKKIWELGINGCHLIRDNIKNYSIDCDYHIADSLTVASSNAGYDDDIKPEYKARKDLGYDARLFEKEELTYVVGSQNYYGAISYSDTFAINSFLYLQGMKNVLLDQGVKIYEDTPAVEILKNEVRTHYGNIKAHYIILCTDRFTPDLHKLEYEISSVQTFLMISAPLKENEVRSIFPERNYMVWDTELIYNYYRIAYDNRLLIGGSTIWYTYEPAIQYDKKSIYKKLSDYAHKTFPSIKSEFHYMWPGFIGVSKDILPIAGRDKDNQSLYYVAAAAGLPWAATLGNYSADALIDGSSEFDSIFTPYRHFTYGRGIQSILGKRLTFALSHLTTLQSL